MDVSEEMEFWMGDFGKEYCKRNNIDFDNLYISKYGISRTALNKEFLSDLPHDSKILEVGCNTGKQLHILKKMGFTNLFGIEINKYAIQQAYENGVYNAIEGSALDIPFKDNFFDLAFTSGVLIHICPNDVIKAIKELYRVSRKFIWGFEYFSENLEETNYQSHKNKLWKNNFSKLILENLPNTKLLKEKKIVYLNDNKLIDSMYLIEILNKVN